MWTYLIGPILSIFPRPWRALLSSAKNLNWERATAISGFCEAVIGLAALIPHLLSRTASSADLKKLSSLNSRSDIIRP